MRLSLTVIALIFALMFGALTVVGGMQSASAGEGDDDTQTLAPDSNGCLNDDGDDDLPDNEEPVDDPDSEDGEDEENLPGSEDGDAEEDGDPPIEEDDCPVPTPVPPAALECGDMTGPGLYLFSDANYGGMCIRFVHDSVFVDYDLCWGQGFPCWNDITSSAKVVNLPFGVYVCLHANYAGNCEHLTANVPNFNVLPNEDCGVPAPACSLDENLSSLYFPTGPVEVPAEPDTTVAASFAAADANCDGGVGVDDAMTSLQYLSGFEVGCTGDWDGDSYQGDADCDGDIGSGDVMAILAVVATGSESAC